MRRNFTRIIILTTFLMGLPLPAHAHAIVVKSEPESGTTLPGPDVAIALTYNVRIDAERSKLTLIAPDGTTSDVFITADPGPEMLTGSATGLTPGTYVLRWQVLASDGHITRGDIPFTIAP
jgi:methionine-rich copper-binding protein CopC